MATIADIANNLIKIFSPDRFISIVDKFIRTKYAKGAQEIEKEFGFNVNFGEAQRDISMLREYVFSNIKGMTDEIQDDLRQSLQRGIMNGDSATQLKKDVANIFRGDNPTRFHFENRVKMIARTEGKRAYEMSKFSNMERLDRPNMYKYLSIISDSRTSDICKAEMAKYGTKEQAIPIHSDFVVKADGKTYRAKHSPFHINCFLAGTKILTEKGYKNIEDINIGDKVTTHKKRNKEVYGTMNRKTDRIYIIETSKGTISVTGEHPIMTSKGWKLAKDLKEDDWVMSI